MIIIYPFCYRITSWFAKGRKNLVYVQIRKMFSDKTLFAVPFLFSDFVLNPLLVHIPFAMESEVMDNGSEMLMLYFLYIVSCKEKYHQCLTGR